MSTDQTNPLDNEQVREPTELEILKDRARRMGITFSNNIGLEALRQKIADKQEGKPEAPPVTPTDLAAQLSALSQNQEQNQQTNQAQPPVNPLGNDLPPVEKPVKQLTLAQQLRLDALKLVRIRIQCLDPKKKDLRGEFFTVANEYIGAVKKFVPYGDEISEDGYHVPHCIYELLKNKKFLNIRTTKDRKTGTPKVEQSMVPEFAIEVLPQLTREELNKLAAAQAAAGSLN